VQSAAFLLVVAAAALSADAQSVSPFGQNLTGDVRRVARSRSSCRIAPAAILCLSRKSTLVFLHFQHPDR